MIGSVYLRGIMNLSQVAKVLEFKAEYSAINNQYNFHAVFLFEDGAKETLQVAGPAMPAEIAEITSKFLTHPFAGFEWAMDNAG